MYNWNKYSACNSNAALFEPRRREKNVYTNFIYIYEVKSTTFNIKGEK